jgi:hypothetical protein
VAAAKGEPGGTGRQAQRACARVVDGGCLLAHMAKNEIHHARLSTEISKAQRGGSCTMLAEDA